MSKKCKPREQKTGELNTIRVFYEKAWKAIVDDDFKKATDLLYKEMPPDLYDISLNILYNTNEDKAFDDDLQVLITKVDDKLCQESIENLDFEDNLDEFNNQF